VVSDFDMHVLSVSDLEVIEAADLEFPNAKKVNGFCIWFEALFVPFSDESLDTSPKCEPTHWNQELLMLDQELLLQDDEILLVSLRIERNAYWRRHYVLYLKLSVKRGETVVEKGDHVFYHHRFPSEKGK
jgi:hypothetical protein